MDRFDINDLKQELTKLIGMGEDAYSVALSGITSYHVISSQKSMDFGYFEFLEEVGADIDPDPFLEEDKQAFLEISILYYLLARNSRSFRQAINWLPGLTADQKKIVSAWPKNYIFSIFQLKVKDDDVIYQDLKDGKEYTMNFSASSVGLADANKDKLTMISLIVPVGQHYMSAPLVFYPVNELAFAKMKKAKDKINYEYAVLLEASDYLSDLYEDDDDFDFDDLFDYDDFHPFYAAERTSGESDQDFAKRLLEQSKFFEDFEHHSQAEKFMIKVIQTFPQLFHSYANAHELLEALRLLFVDEQFDVEELQMLSDEVPIFWFTLIKKHLPQEVAALEPYIVPDVFDDNELPF